MTRFAIYETVRDTMTSGNQGPIPFYQKVLLAAFGGEFVWYKSVETSPLTVSYCAIGWSI